MKDILFLFHLCFQNCTHTRTHPHPHTQARAQTQTLIHNQSHTAAYPWNTHTHTHTHTSADSHVGTHSLTPTRTLSLFLSLPHVLSLSLSLPHVLSLSLSLSPTRTLSLSHTYTHARTHSIKRDGPNSPNPPSSQTHLNHPPTATSSRMRTHLPPGGVAPDLTGLFGTRWSSSSSCCVVATTWYSGSPGCARAHVTRSRVCRNRCGSVNRSPAGRADA